MIVYIDAYHSGSHRAFYEGWSSRSRYAFTLIDYPGRHWKWRMRHSALSAAHEIAAMPEPPGVIVATDMCNASELRGHLPARLRSVPLVVYFHEHQLTYPVRGEEQERDDHFALTNLASALAADAVWCNSRYLLGSMVDGLRELLRRMPSPRLIERLPEIEAKARVLPPGVDDALFESPRDAQGRGPGMQGRPLRILWNARWEHDKGPHVIAAALEALASRGVPFECDLVGPSTDGASGLMGSLRQRLGERIHRFGRQAAEAYRAALGEADVVISAASHEFFGIAVVEAAASGALPVVPRALAYPEVLEGVPAMWFDGCATGLAEQLAMCAGMLGNDGTVWGGDADAGRAGVRHLGWSSRARALDEAIEGVIDAGDDA